MELDQEIARQMQTKVSDEARREWDKLVDHIQNNLVGKEPHGECRDFKGCVGKDLGSLIGHFDTNVIYACEKHGADPYDVLDLILDFMKTQNNNSRIATLEAQAKTAALNGTLN